MDADGYKELGKRIAIVDGEIYVSDKAFSRDDFIVLEMFDLNNHRKTRIKSPSTNPVHSDAVTDVEVELASGKKMTVGSWYLYHVAYMANILHAIDALSDEKLVRLAQELDIKILRSRLFDEADKELQIGSQYAAGAVASAIEQMAKESGKDSAAAYLSEMTTQEVANVLLRAQRAICNTHDVNAFLGRVMCAVQDVAAGKIERAEAHEHLAEYIRSKAPWWEQIEFLDLS